MKTLLPDYSVIQITGKDARDFLHRQLSNHINGLSSHQACWATYNTAQGRVFADCYVIADENDVFWMIVAQDLAFPIIERLRKYIMRSQVVLELAENWRVAGTLPEEKNLFRLPENSKAYLPCVQKDSVLNITLLHGGILSVAPMQNLPSYDAECEHQWRLWEMQNGFAHIQAATSEKCVAQMLNYHRLGAIHFQKGCYPGQEIIARSQYRGSVKRGLVLAKADVILPIGDSIDDAEEKSIGCVMQSLKTHSGSLNLCVVKNEAQNLSVNQIPLEVEKTFS